MCDCLSECANEFLCVYVRAWCDFLLFISHSIPFCSCIVCLLQFDCFFFFLSSCAWFLSFLIHVNHTHTYACTIYGTKYTNTLQIHTLIVHVMCAWNKITKKIYNHIELIWNTQTKLCGEITEHACVYVKLATSRSCWHFFFSGNENIFKSCCQSY